MRKIMVLLAVGVASLATLFANGSSETAGQAETETGNGGKKIAICLSTGGLGDKNFNDMAYAGLERAQKELGITFNYYEPETSSDFEGALRNFADAGDYDLIIGIGGDMVDAMKEVTPDYPDQKFSIVDASLDLPNVKANATKWQEQTFLCGMYAGLGTLSDMPYANKENVIGVILGMDTPVLRAGVVGFIAGARYVNPDVEVIESVVGAFNDPAKGKEIGISMHNRGADFIQHIAGADGLGLFQAAKENNFYAFGVGGNQNYIEPDVICATSIRNVDEMVYNEVKAVVDGTWKAGNYLTGLKEGSVGYSNAQSNVQVPPEIAEAIAQATEDIKSGKLVVCSTKEELDDWVKNNQYKK